MTQFLCTQRPREPHGERGSIWKIGLAVNVGHPLGSPYFTLFYPFLPLYRDHSEGLLRRLIGLDVASGLKKQPGFPHGSHVMDTQHLDVLTANSQGYPDRPGGSIGLFVPQQMGNEPFT